MVLPAPRSSATALLLSSWISPDSSAWRRSAQSPEDARRTHSSTRGLSFMTMQEDTTAANKVAPQQVLTFVLGSETYGVDILRVQEIRGWSAVTKIPHAPPYV